MQIEGTIKYKVELNDKGETVLEYESTLENDIAAMAIAEYVCSEWINHIKEEKSNHTGKVKAQINDRLNRTLQVKSGLKTLTDYAFAMYKVFKGLGASADAKEENSDDINKEEVLKVINNISEKRDWDKIPELMKTVSDYVVNTNPLRYHELIEFINSTTSGKLGGIYIAQSKAMTWLKEELYKIKKQSPEFEEIEPFVFEKEYDIWTEGFAVTGNQSEASYIGKASGKTFNEACDNFRYPEDVLGYDGKVIIKKGDPLGLDKNSDGKNRYDRPSIWACRLWDNEADARKAFG